MMRNRFDEQLHTLSNELTQMGAMCEQAIALSAKALISSDKQLIEKTTAVDSEIDKMERDIETLCLKLLLSQQPVASDLRQISAALKMITDMERIGDQAADIAEIAKFIGGRHIEGYDMIYKMAEAAAGMVTESIDAYVRSDTELAWDTIRRDDVVDAYFTAVKTELIAAIAAHPENGELALDLLMTAKYFERIGDHATNIAEWVVFFVTGVHPETEQLEAKGDL